MVTLTRLSALRYTFIARLVKHAVMEIGDYQQFPVSVPLSANATWSDLLILKFQTLTKHVMKNKNLEI
jgi:hypothetical protein